MPGSGLITFLSAGAVLGLTAGISPGPLLALVISETLKHNKRTGFKIALTPLISDLPIIIFSLIILSLFACSGIALGVISFMGGVFVTYLGIDCIKTRGLAADTYKTGMNPLGKGTIVNILNPHPYLFWITVGAPMIMKARQNSIWSVVVFFLAFYFFLVGSKIIVALLVDHSRAFLKNKTYIWIMRILGIFLLVFAVFFFCEGIKIVNGLMNH
jgi:threonine/homoserine/homoserine lactone efflux protein